ncbi:MAG: hypothetical protein AAGF45_11195 [Pseudomonadota bacterium]
MPASRGRQFFIRSPQDREAAITKQYPDLDRELLVALEARARKHDRSLSDEIEATLRAWVFDDLGTRIHKRFARFGGMKLPNDRDARERETPTFE